MRIVLKCSTFGSNAYPISRAEALEHRGNHIPRGLIREAPGGVLAP